MLEDGIVLFPTGEEYVRLKETLYPVINKYAIRTREDRPPGETVFVTITPGSGVVGGTPLDYESIAYGNEIFVGVRRGRQRSLEHSIISDDGFHFRRIIRANDLIDATFHGTGLVAFGNDVFVTMFTQYPTADVATRRVTTWVSTNGINWRRYQSPVNVGASLQYVNGALFIGGKFIIISWSQIGTLRDTRRVYVSSSPDGIDWATREITLGKAFIRSNNYLGGQSITHDGIRFLLVAYLTPSFEDSGIFIATSDDAINWEELCRVNLELPPSPNAITGFDYVNGIYTLITSNRLFSSLDLLNWQEYNVPSQPTWRTSIVHDDNLHIISWPLPLTPITAGLRILSTHGFNSWIDKTIVGLSEIHTGPGVGQIIPSARVTAGMGAMLGIDLNGNVINI